MRGPGALTSILRTREAGPRLRGSTGQNWLRTRLSDEWIYRSTREASSSLVSARVRSPSRERRWRLVSAEAIWTGAVPV